MRSLVNVDIDYEDGRLRMRPGYVRWNDTALPAVAEQLYDFVDLSGNQHLLGICNSRWYEFKATGAHVMLVDEAATAPRPIIGYRDRVVFATDTSWYWTDDAQLTGTPKSHRLGIKQPTEAVTLQTYADPGHMGTPDASKKIRINTSTQRKVGIKFVAGTKIEVAALSVSLRRFESRQDLSGSIRVGIYTDASGEPSTTLAHADAVSNWQQVARLSYGSWAYKRLTFETMFELLVGTYWIVLEGDDAYYNNYYAPSEPAPDTADFYAGVGHEDAPASYSHGKTQVYDSGTGNWSELDKEAVFQMSGLETGRAYEYVMTYLNSTYMSESRPSDGTRIVVGSEPVVGIINYPTTTDAQVDKLRFYRREMPELAGDDIDATEDEITDSYKLLAEVDIWLAFFDTLPTAALGAILQTQDHYTYDETDSGPDASRPVALVPGPAAQFKDRIWFAEPTGIALYLSKILEEDGASGITNDAIPDYFPLGNALDFSVSSSIIAVEPMSDDQLVVYFQDESAWVVWGANESLNPPPDINMREQLSTGGLFTARGMDRTSRRHVIITSDGLWGFAGTRGMPELLSETNQSLFTDIENDYLDNSRVVVYDGEIWALVDLDNDGDLETVMILDMLRDIPTRQMVDRAWRMYQYDVALNDMVLRKRGDTQKHILAADAENPYILRLGSGTTDNGTAIVGRVEMHNVKARNLVMLSGIELDAKYPSTAPTYTIYGYASDGSVESYSLSPTSDQDIRGHRAGMRVLAVGDARIKIEITSSYADELKSFLLHYVTE